MLRWLLVCRLFTVVVSMLLFASKRESMLCFVTFWCQFLSCFDCLYSKRFSSLPVKCVGSGALYRQVTEQFRPYGVKYVQLLFSLSWIKYLIWIELYWMRQSFRTAFVLLHIRFSSKTRTFRFASWAPNFSLQLLKNACPPQDHY